jgi:DNA polymerase III delta subunit
MIYLFHGDDLAKTREAIFNLISKANINTKLEIDLAQTTPDEIYTQVFAKDLFGGNRCLIIDISKMGKTDIVPYMEKIQDKPADLLLIIFTDKPLTKANALIKNTLKIPMKIYEFNKVVEGKTFNYVDALFTKDRKKAYKELNLLEREDEDIFKILGAIQFSLRNILYIKFHAPQASSMHPFVKAKATSQSKKFEDDELKQLAEYIYDIEKGSKTGEISQELMLTLITEKVLNS